jgi:molybdopterin synthase sulfur carrier subunit
MPQVVFGAQLQRFVVCPAQQVAATTLGGALAAAFAAAPGIRAYVLDDQGRVRRNVAVFINGTLLHDRKALVTPLAPDDSVYVIQALSGG